MAPSSRRDYSLDDWLRRFETLHPKKIDLTLDRVTAVIERLELKPPPYKVVTVGGTNGKGSCVAMLESIYWHAGYAVGAFTSPHLWRFNERIRVNGADANDAELVELFEIIDSTLGGDHVVVLRVLDRGGAAAVRAQAAWTSRCSRSVWADGSTRRTRSTPIARSW